MAKLSSSMLPPLVLAVAYGRCMRNCLSAREIAVGMLGAGAVPFLVASLFAKRRLSQTFLSSSFSH